MQVKYNASNQTIHSTLSQAMLLFRSKHYLSAQTNFYCEYELYFFSPFSAATWFLAVDVLLWPSKKLVLVQSNRFSFPIEAFVIFFPPFVRVTFAFIVASLLIKLVILGKYYRDCYICVI